MTGPPAPDARRAANARAWLAPVAAAVATVAVYRGSLGYFFGQDDFLGLARARGLAPALHGPWRWLSGQGYFDLMRPLGVTTALPYHAASLLAHAAATALLAHLLQRRFSSSAALLGALLFGAHPALYTAIYSVSGIGEILAALFALATLALAAREDRWRWAAPAAFALALLSKESVLLLPLALMPRSGWLAAGGRAGARPPRARGPWVALASLSVAGAAALFASDVFGVRSHLASSAPYAVTLGPHVIGNLATYLAWTVNFLILTTRNFNDAIDPGALPLAGITALLWLIGLASPRLRERGWGAGGLTFAALLAPVLGLRNHTYHYYLYAPLIGTAWCAAALFDAAFERAFATGRRHARDSRAAARGTRKSARGEAPGSPPRALPSPTREPGSTGTWPALGASGTTAWILGAILVLNGALLVHKVEVYPFTDPRLRADPLVDRALIAGRVRDGLAAADLPSGAALRFWSPASIRLERGAHPEGDALHHETYWESNVRTALMEGLGVRVLFPRVGDVSFVHEYVPARASASARVAIYNIDGTTRVMTAAMLDSAMAGAARERR